MYVVGETDATAEGIGILFLNRIDSNCDPIEGFISEASRIDAPASGKDFDEPAANYLKFVCCFVLVGIEPGQQLLKFLRCRIALSFHRRCMGYFGAACDATMRASLRIDMQPKDENRKVLEESNKSKGEAPRFGPR